MSDSEKLSKYERKEQESRVDTENFAKKGDVQEYTFYDERVSMNQRELVIDFVNWKRENQKELIIPPYFNKEDKDESQGQPEHSIMDIYPYKKVGFAGITFAQFCSIWLFIGPKLIIGGLAVISLLLTLVLFPVPDSASLGALTQALSVFIVFCLIIAIGIISIAESANLQKLFFTKMGVHKDKRVKSYLDIYIMIAGGLIFVYWIYVAIDATYLFNAAYEGFLDVNNLIVLLSITALHIYLPLITYGINLVLYQTIWKNRIKTDFQHLPLEELEEVPGILMWKHPKIKYEQTDHIFDDFTTGKISRWWLFLYPFKFRHDRDYFSNYIYTREINHIENTSELRKIIKAKEIQKWYHITGLACFGFSLLNLFANLNTNYRIYIDFMITIIAIIVVLELIFKFELVINPNVRDIFNEPIYSSDTISEFAIEENNVYVITIQGKCYKSKEEIQLEEVQSQDFVPEMFIEEATKYSTKIIFDTNKSLILYGYRVSDLKEIIKKSSKKGKEKAKSKSEKG